MRSDVIVIGAGLGGLSAAIRLAAAGRHVVIFERNQDVGGKLAEWSQDGFRWDTGPSVLTMRPVLEELFAAAGHRADEYLELLTVDPLTRYYFPDGIRLDICRDLANTLQGIGRIKPRDVDGYLRFLAKAARLHRLTSPVFTFGPPPSLKSLGRIPPFAIPGVAIQALQSLHQSIRSDISSPHLRQLLGRFATYVGSSPYLASAVLAVIAHVELNEGICYVRGGMHVLGQALEKMARSLGVEIYTGKEVTSILCSRNSGGRLQARGVKLQGGDSILADVVLANLDVTTVYEQLLPSSEGQFSRVLGRLNRMEKSCSGFILLLGVERVSPELAHHTIFFSTDYQREFRTIFQNGLPSDDPTIYVAITSKTDPQHAPPGCENWFVLVNVPPVNRRYDWDGNKDAYASLVIDRLANHGLDVRGRIVVKKVITPSDLERMNGARHGSLYGVSFNDRLAPFRRPGNRCPEVEGLFFAGGTTHPGGGIPMVILSGKVAAGMILGVE